MALDRIDGLGSYNGQSTGNSNKRVTGREGSEDAGEFTLLKDEAEGVIYEPGRQTERPKTLGQIREEIAREERSAAQANLHSRFDGPGVMVELSTDGVAKQEKQAPDSLFDIVKDFFKAIGEFFSGIWNGGADGPVAKEASAAEASENGAGSDTETETDTAAETEALADTEAVAGTEALSETGTTPGAGAGAYEMPVFGEADKNMPPIEEASGAPRMNRTQPRSPLERENTPEAAFAFLEDYGGGHLANNSDLLNRYDRSGHIVSLDPSDKRRILHGEGRVRKY